MDCSVEVCGFARARRAKICKEQFETMPDFGCCASQRTTCFGYMISIDFKNIDLSKGSIADIHYMQDVGAFLSNSTVIGDKGYLSHEIQHDLLKQTEYNVILRNVQINQISH